MSYSILSTKVLPKSLHETVKEKGFLLSESNVIETIPSINDLLKERIEEAINESFNQAAIFTSEQAIIALKEVYPPQEFLPWDVFCIHGATKEAVLKNYPKSNIVGTAGYGLDLSKLIVDSHYDHYHFFCGNRRREVIPTALTDNNKEWTEYIVYRTQLIPQSLPLAEFVMFYSPSGVESFFMYNTLTNKSVCVAIGETTAESLEQHTQNTVIISKETNPASMFNAIEQYIKNNLTTI